MGSASAYKEVLNHIEEDVKTLQSSHPDFFATQDQKALFEEVRDFQTAGVVAFSKGCPFFNLKTGYLTLGDKRIQVNKENLGNCKAAVEKLVEKL